MELFKIKNEIKSPLRYPGGKSRAIKQILPIIPPFKEFREPFIGGGSVFIAVRQRVTLDKIFVINDLNTDLYCFWKIARDANEELIKALQKIKKTFQNGKELYHFLKTNPSTNDFDRAVRFFTLNRITFSGLADSGGYSQQAFEKRFTLSSIDRISKIKPLLKNVIITNEDYEKIVLKEGKNVFIFLDPPYCNTTQKRLYGKIGDLHLSFDHERFAKIMKRCDHKWLITYDDSKVIRNLFHFANIVEWELQYGMNNYMQSSAKKGRELFIFNYNLPEITDSPFITVKSPLNKQFKRKPLEYFLRNIKNL
ncbi:MAG: DNA adenine methylase [Candidatus Helarchaeota archaeon]